MTIIRHGGTTPSPDLAVMNRNKEFSAWRARVAGRLPELASRVFALRRVTYSGCGYQWFLEASLGRVINHIQNYDNADLYHSEDAAVKQLLVKMMVAHLFKSVIATERSIAKRCAKCNQLKPITEFGWQQKSAGCRNNICRPCAAARAREWYASNRKHVSETRKQRHYSRE